MPRKKSKAVPEGNGPVPQHDEIGCGEPTMAGLYRMIQNNLDRMDKNFDRMSSYLDRQHKQLVKLTEKLGATNQHLAGLQHKARQPRVATEADVKPDTKTRKRTENPAVDRVLNRDNSSARVNDGPTSLTRFGMIAEPLALPIFGDDALVDKGAEAPKPCLSLVETRTPPAADGLLPTGTASTAMRGPFPRRLFPGGKTNKRTSRSNFNQLPTPFWRNVLEPKSRNVMERGA